MRKTLIPCQDRLAPLYPVILLESNATDGDVDSTEVTAVRRGIERKHDSLPPVNEQATRVACAILVVVVWLKPEFVRVCSIFFVPPFCGVISFLCFGIYYKLATIFKQFEVSC